MISDFTIYPRDYVPGALSTQLVKAKDSRYTSYAPPIHVDEIGLTSDKYIPLNATTNDLSLKISVGAMSLQRWLLMSHLEESLKGQRDLGFENKDIDDIRRLISDTPVTLIMVTLLASILHLLFEVLAFQSDISFWKSAENTTGLSTRAVFGELISQTVILAFLVDTEASLLISIPMSFGIFIQIWKVWKVWKLNQQTKDRKTLTASDSSEVSNKSSSDIKASNEDEQEKYLSQVTVEADILATTYISHILVPLLIGYYIYTLLYEKHTSWYSWVVASASASVYGFGFMFMCPQLLINYKLKSVARLPWKTLIYRFLNTFIDDLFAFIIVMPTIHRLSVFRDDIVFFIYLFQRWKYAVDTSRPIEK